MADEIELKFFIEDYELITKKLLNLGTYKKSAHELTVMYDNETKYLFKDDARLRLRRIVDLKDKRESSELTYKKPKTREDIKIEEEHETEVSSFNETETILEKMGYTKVSSYERIRDTFEIDGCKVTIDSFSFGDLLEIEGEMGKIKEIAKDIGLDLKENTTKSCDDIYEDICQKRGEDVNDYIILDSRSLLMQINRRHFLTCDPRKTASS